MKKHNAIPKSFGFWFDCKYNIWLISTISKVTEGHYWVQSGKAKCFIKIIKLSFWFFLHWTSHINPFHGLKATMWSCQKFSWLKKILLIKCLFKIGIFVLWHGYSNILNNNGFHCKSNFKLHQCKLITFQRFSACVTVLASISLV